MGLFKKKPVYTPPVRNDRPVQLRYNIEKDTYREEATIIVDNKLQNKNGVPTEWLTFPKYFDYREEAAIPVNTPFGHYFKELYHEGKCRVTKIYCGKYGTSDLEYCHGYVKGFVLPETVVEVGGFGQTHVPIIVPDGLRKVIGKGLYDYNGYLPGLNRIANYYEGAWYFGNEKNPYHVLICADHEAEKCIIHPNTVIIQEDAFSRRYGNNQYRNFLISSLVIPASVKYIGRQDWCNYITDIQFEEPKGWYSILFSGYSIDGKIYGDATEVYQFCGGLKKK